MGKKIVNALTPDHLEKHQWYSDYINLLGQVLTWCYFSETGMINEEIRFNTDIYHTHDQELIPEILSSGLSGVLGFRNDSVWHSAWERYEKFIQTVPSSEIIRLISSISTAKRHSLIKYNELADILYRKYLKVRPALPEEVIDLLTKMFLKGHHDNLYISGDGAFGLIKLLVNQNFNLFFEYPHPETIHSLISLLSNRITIQAGDPVVDPAFFQHGMLKKFSSGVGVLMHDHRYRVNEIRDLFGRFTPGVRDKEILFITHMLHQCTGSTVLVIPGRFLLKNTSECRNFRQKLVRDGRLSAVLRLPDGLLPGRAHPMFILLFVKRDSRSIKFINCDNDYYKAVSVKKRGEAKYRLMHQDVIIDELHESSNHRTSYQIDCIDLLNSGNINFPLDPAFYLKTNHALVFRSSEDITSPLEDGFKIIRAQALKGSTDEPNSVVFIEVTSGDINAAGIVEKPNRVVQVAHSELKRAEGQKLQSGDILLAIKGQAGKVALIPDFCGNNWIAGQSFVIIRRREGNTLLSSVVLFRFLKSETGKKMLDCIRTDSNVPFIHSQDLKQLPLPSWSRLEQEQACRAHEEVLKLYARMNFFREKAELIESEILKEH